jgi:hypothetical protein
MKKTLKVKAVGDSPVQNYQAMQEGLRRYIGRVYDASLLKYDEESEEVGKVSHKGGWILLDEVVEVPNTTEYRHEVKEGNLVAADEQTAMICGVKFNKDKQ